jgi:polyhydroxyalkanoate synthesis regulator phasin
MNPTLRRLLVAGLGTLALTEKAARRLIDDLVAKGDITGQEGERVLTLLERRWDEESGRLAHEGEKARQELEKLFTRALKTALDRAGLARKSEVEELRRKLEGRGATRGRAAGAPGRRPRRAGKTPGSRKPGPA